MSKIPKLSPLLLIVVVLLVVGLLAALIFILVKCIMWITILLCTYMVVYYPCEYLKYKKDREFELLEMKQTEKITRPKKQPGFKKIDLPSFLNL